MVTIKDQVDENGSFSNTIRLRTLIFFPNEREKPILSLIYIYV